MKRDFLLQKIEAIGFSEKEAAIYFATLECGLAPAAKIAENAHINRATTYDILEKLLRRGAVVFSEKHSIRHFSAVSPEILLESAKRAAADFSAIVPDLRALATEHEFRPVVRVFEGIEGVKRGYHETLFAHGEILSLANSQNIREHWREYDTEYVARRAEKRIFLRGVAPEDSAGKKIKQEDTQYFREIRLLPPSLFPPKTLENEINLWDDKMLIASFSPHSFALLIDSPAVFASQKTIFEILWNLAGKNTLNGS